MLKFYVLDCFLQVRKRVCLEGEELEAFKTKEREEKLANEASEKLAAVFYRVSS